MAEKLVPIPALTPQEVMITGAALHMFKHQMEHFPGVKEAVNPIGQKLLRSLDFEEPTELIGLDSTVYAAVQLAHDCELQHFMCLMLLNIVEAAMGTHADEETVTAVQAAMKALRKTDEHNH